ncbi:MAG: FtsQ-type POTRA domain-containing protein [Bacteroidota bacterium]
MKTTRKLTFGFISLVLLGGFLVAGANFWKSSLTVHRVLVHGNSVVQTNEILQLAHVNDGARMYDLDLLKIQKDVVSHYFIKAVLVERDLPSTIRIKVTERAPVAMINPGELRYLDPDGVVLPHSVSGELFDLPLIGGIPPDVSPKVGATLTHSDIQEALTILSTARLVNKEMFHLISEVRLRNGGDIVLYTAEGSVPVLFGRGNVASKLVRLETFWNGIVRERGSRLVQYIDVRFDDQVVVRWKDQQGKLKLLPRS